jgi:hypothetical protein
MKRGREGEPVIPELNLCMQFNERLSTNSWSMSKTSSLTMGWFGPCLRPAQLKQTRAATGRAPAALAGRSSITTPNWISGCTRWTFGRPACPRLTATDQPCRIGKTSLPVSHLRARCPTLASDDCFVVVKVDFHELWNYVSLFTPKPRGHKVSNASRI